MIFTSDNWTLSARRWGVAGTALGVIGLGAWLGWSEISTALDFGRDRAGFPETPVADAALRPGHPVPRLSNPPPELAGPVSASSQEAADDPHSEPASPVEEPVPFARPEQALAPVAIPQQERLDLQRRAQRIETRAILELDRLTPALGLTSNQQDRVFDVLVRRSPEFDPVMVAVNPGGTPIAAGPTAPATQPRADSPTGADSPTPCDPGTAPAPHRAPESVPGTVLESAGPAASDPPRTPQDEILDLLTPEQAVRYVENEADRMAWWNEIVAHLDSTTEAPKFGAGPDPGYGGTSPGQTAADTELPDPSPAEYGGQ
ncbi:hypothetical protein BH23VER1_BH23VER1_03680 [soil metagenome]